MSTEVKKPQKQAWQPRQSMGWPYFLELSCHFQQCKLNVCMPNVSKAIQMWPIAMTWLLFLAIKWAFSRLPKTMFFNLWKSIREWRFFQTFYTQKLRNIPSKLSGNRSKHFLCMYFLPLYIMKLKSFVWTAPILQMGWRYHCQIMFTSFSYQDRILSESWWHL